MSTAIRRTGPEDSSAREFEETFLTHYDLVHGTAFGVTGSREDAEDVVQTVFLRLLRHEMPPDMQKKAKPYPYRAPVNESLNIIRNRRRHPTTDLKGWKVRWMESNRFEQRPSI